jgi:hypothetical protein
MQAAETFLVVFNIILEVADEFATIKELDGRVVDRELEYVVVNIVVEVGILVVFGIDDGFETVDEVARREI